MANQRHPDQVFVGIWISKGLAAKVDSNRGRTSRSQYLRDAIATLLEEEGVPVPAGEKAAPDRVRYQQTPHHFEMNEPASSASASAATKLLKKGAASVKHPDSK